MDINLRSINGSKLFYINFDDFFEIVSEDCE